MKCRRLALFFLTPLTVVLAACGTVSGSVRPDSTFRKHSSLTVLVQSDDRLGTQGTMEHLLLERGFNVISAAVAQQKRESHSRTDISGKTAESAGDPAQTTFDAATETSRSSGNVTEVNSTHVLRFKYSAYFDVVHWSCTRLSGSVIDLADGAVVASFQFSGDRSIDSVLTSVADKLALSTE